MAFSSKKVRPLFTLVFAILGGVAGNAYVSSLLNLIKAKDHNLFGIIPINQTPLNSNEQATLYVGFIILGALFGFMAERIAYVQAAKTRLKLESMAAQDKIAVVVGLLVGLLLTALIVSILKIPLYMWWVNIILAVLLCYISVAAADSLKEQVRFYFPGSMPSMKGDYKSASRPKILDTNVIIDGRIADIAKAGFVEGPIYVPKFILEELQQIADSSDSLKRARGRRGLDILNQMQKEMELIIPEFEADSSDEEVDARLVRVAREVIGIIVTNDYNLNRVAELQGVEVMNINELANALKPVVLPGEEMRVIIIREGKEKEQGIGYLDDGTMIVVEGARRLIGESLLVCVTSVLQTVQGKMIFGKIKDDAEQENESFEDSIRSYSGGRPRKKIR
ncbi:MAG: TRAM domain-containing protein [Armatimonadetes bacterium]|nr:TRAM domain-containing protein [Armatimonadota bacterium]